jgi:hypothetical protein
MHTQPRGQGQVLREPWRPLAVAGLRAPAPRLRVARARPRPRAEARIMYKQLWGIESSPGRRPRGRAAGKGFPRLAQAMRGAPRPSACMLPAARDGRVHRDTLLHCAGVVRKRRVVDALVDADVYHGQGRVISLSDTDSDGWESGLQSPAESSERSGTSSPEQRQWRAARRWPQRELHGAASGRRLSPTPPRSPASSSSRSQHRSCSRSPAASRGSGDCARVRRESAHSPRDGRAGHASDARTAAHRTGRRATPRILTEQRRRALQALDLDAGAALTAAWARRKAQRRSAAHAGGAAPAAPSARAGILDLSGLEQPASSKPAVAAPSTAALPEASISASGSAGGRRGELTPRGGGLEAHALTGAQRRRLRRLQEDQQLAQDDPAGWARLQAARRAMMPYGWDKCAPVAAHVAGHAAGYGAAVHVAMLCCQPCDAGMWRH